MSTLLETVVNDWAGVRAENDRDKDLVTPEQLRNWEEFEERTTDRLKSIIENYDGEELSETDRDWLKDLGNTIQRARRVSREDLEAKKQAHEAELERKRLEEEARLNAEKIKREEAKRTQNRLLETLGLDK